MTRTEPDIRIPDLSGRLAVVTGGSDGIGLGIATRLAMAGAEVVLPVRNPRKGETAVARIRAQAPGVRVSLRELELSSLRSVRALGETLLEEGRPIHLLVNNAGVMTPPARTVTEDGFELQFGTNHLGHAALAGLLLPLLREGRARVVSQVSVAAAGGRILWDDLNGERSYDGCARTGSRRSLSACSVSNCSGGRRRLDGGSRASSPTRASRPRTCSPRARNWGARATPAVGVSSRRSRRAASSWER